jgi:peptide deformylase
MALTLRLDGDPILRTRCKTLLGLPPESFIQSMFELMQANKGIGLSANQVGVLQRFLIVQVKRPLVLLNPRIKKYYGKRVEIEEGCLSFPGHYEIKGRYAKILVEYVDMTGKLCKVFFEGLEAAVIQHEVNHLNGIAFK